jgi:hypothetical protein
MFVVQGAIIINRENTLVFIAYLLQVQLLL